MFEVVDAMRYSVKENALLLWLWRVIRFYLEGFRSMTVGKTLWMIIFIKLFLMFAVLKVWFFSDYLKTNFFTDEQRAEHVLEQITLQTKVNAGENNE